MLEDLNYSSRRLNPLTGDYVLVSPLRKQRPWSQSLEAITEDELPKFESKCNLCPGVSRPNGRQNPNYQDIYVFDNDFPALASVEPTITPEQSDIFQETMETGVCEVMCYSPDHNRNMIHFSHTEIMAIIMAWKSRYEELGARTDINYVQIFESRGKEVGNSAPHPHCQVWAQKSIPTIPTRTTANQERYFQKHGTAILVDYVQEEIARQTRVLFSTDNFTIVVPFWAEWPYETMILAHQPIQSLAELTEIMMRDLASCLSAIAKIYAGLFQRPSYGAPYMMGIHQVPTDGRSHPGCQLFFKFVTPLLTPNRQKYQAGYEKNAETQRDLTPEAAAADLRAVTIF